MNQIQNHRAQVAQRLSESFKDSPFSLQKGEELDPEIVDFLEKGKSLPVGTIKKRPNGNFIKTANGWKYHSSASTPIPGQKGGGDKSSSKSSEDSDGKKVVVGDTVTIGPLQSDPIKKQGESGKVIGISDNGKTVKVQFADKTVGLYSDGSFEKKQSTDKKEDSIEKKVEEIFNANNGVNDSINFLRRKVNDRVEDSSQKTALQKQIDSLEKDAKEGYLDFAKKFEEKYGDSELTLESFRPNVYRDEYNRGDSIAAEPAIRFSRDFWKKDPNLLQEFKDNWKTKYTSEMQFAEEVVYRIAGESFNRPRDHYLYYGSTVDLDLK